MWIVTSRRLFRKFETMIPHVQRFSKATRNRWGTYQYDVRDKFKTRLISFLDCFHSDLKINWSYSLRYSDQLILKNGISMLAVQPKTLDKLTLSSVLTELVYNMHERLWRRMEEKKRTREMVGMTVCPWDWRLGLWVGGSSPVTTKFCD